ncbi:hypothetical protein Trydic_g14916 [Trypoxylus dichotomus]
MPRDRDKFIKYESGFDKQKNKVKRDKFLESQTGALVTFLNPIGEEVDDHDVTQTHDDVEKMHLGMASQLLQGLVQFFEQFRNEGFVAAIMVAREMSELLDTEPKFQIVKQRKKRKMFDYDGEDEHE